MGSASYKDVAFIYLAIILISFIICISLVERRLPQYLM